MIKIENFEVLGWEHAIRGMRNPMNSWEKSDSKWCRDRSTCDNCYFEGNVYGDRETYPVSCDEALGRAPKYSVGQNDHKLMMSLAKGGPVHAKYRRMITVYLDITAPLYWWKEFDTYKVGTVANSCSTMHKIHAKKFELDDFSHEDLLSFQDSEFAVDDHMMVYEDYWDPKFMLEMTIRMLNHWRDMYNRIDRKIKTGYFTEQELKHLIAQRKLTWKQMIKLLPTSYNQKRTVMLNYEVLHNIYHSRKNHKLDEWHVFCDWIERLPYSELITGEYEEAAE